MEISHWKIYYYSMEINLFWGEHKVITLKQQILGINLCYFHAFKMASSIASLCVNTYVRLAQKSEGSL